MIDFGMSLEAAEQMAPLLLSFVNGPRGFEVPLIERAQLIYKTALRVLCQ